MTNTTNTAAASFVITKHYAKRDPEAQGDHYINHVSAMTGEGLHTKSDIAAELAHRDIEIDRLRAALATPAQAAALVTPSYDGFMAAVNEMDGLYAAPAPSGAGEYPELPEPWRIGAGGVEAEAYSASQMRAYADATCEARAAAASKPRGKEARERRRWLSDSFNRGTQTLDEATVSARAMALALATPAREVAPTSHPVAMPEPHYGNGRYLGFARHNDAYSVAQVQAMLAAAPRNATLYDPDDVAFPVQRCADGTDAPTELTSTAAAEVAAPIAPGE